MIKCVVGVVAGAALLGGCMASPPRGENTGRVEVTDTTPAERASPQVQLTAQHEFSDRVAQQLAADLQSVPALTEHGYRNTVVFGDIVNKTQGMVPTSEFEAFRMRIRGKLMQSQHVLKHIRFVENRARLDDLRRREGTGGGDILQEGGVKSGATFNPKYTFFLNGEMYRAGRGNYAEVNEYLMSYTLTNMDSGELVWQSAPYEVKQVR
jgi:PBP1b-binding outer membrane lipoprotein LpoB